MTEIPPMMMHAEKCETCTARRPGWFCDLPLHALAEYDALSTHVVAPGGTALFHEGHRARGVSIVCVGRVKLTKTSSEGKTFLVRIANPGEVLGLSAALSHTPYEVTAQALEWTQVKTFRSEDFRKFLEHHAQGSLNAAISLNREYRAALAAACRLAFSNTIVGRMAHLLLHFAFEAGTAQDATPVIRTSLKHDEFASMLGSSRESVTRAFNELKRKGIIEIKGVKITLLRKSALEALL